MEGGVAHAVPTRLLLSCSPSRAGRLGELTERFASLGSIFVILRAIRCTQRRRLQKRSTSDPAPLKSKGFAVDFSVCCIEPQLESVKSVPPHCNMPLKQSN